MDFIAWTDSLSVGVKKFDDEHKQLISLINELNHSMSVGAGSKTMGGILDRLIAYTGSHFLHEEEYMALYDYGNLTEHKKQHEELKAQVIDFRDRLSSGKSSFTIELLIFLRDWLTGHIMKTDMAYKSFFQAKGV